MTDILGTSAFGLYLKVKAKASTFETSLLSDSQKEECTPIARV